MKTNIKEGEFVETSELFFRPFFLFRPLLLRKKL